MNRHSAGADYLLALQAYAPMGPLPRNLLFFIRLSEIFSKLLLIAFPAFFAFLAAIFRI